MTEAPHVQESVTARIPGWLPLGLASFGVLGMLRWFSLLAIDAKVLGADPAQGAWNVANGFPEQLLHLAVFAMAGAAFCEKSEGKRLGLVFAASFVFLCGVTGWPIAPLSFMPQFGMGFGLESVLPLVVACCVWSFALFGFVRMTQGSPRGRVLATGAGVVVAALPFWFGIWHIETPEILVRSTVRQLINDTNFDKLTFTSWPPSIAAEIDRLANQSKAEDEPVSKTVFSADGYRAYLKKHGRKMITPAIYKEYDLGDKYSLVAYPGTAVEFEVSEQGGPVWLRTSVGAHVTAYDDFCPPDEIYDIRFEILVGEELRWEETVRIQQELHVKERVWKHAGGEQGIPLQPGDLVTLRTSYKSDHTPEGVLKFRAVECGWADLILESETPTPRLHSTPEEPNIVLIVMDTLRADRLSSYGYDRNLTPNLTRLADRGIQYDRAYATSSWTWPSTASMLTGLYPAEHGVLSNRACTLAYENETLAEVLQERGFTTGGFSCNPLIHEERYYDQGFETFDATKRFRKGDEITPLVTRWLEQQHGSRFFLYLHMADPHSPHHPHPDDLLRFAGTPPEDTPTNIRQDRPGEKQHASWDWFDHYNGVIEKAWNCYADPKRCNGVAEPGKQPVTNELISLEHQRWVADVYDASVASCDRYVGVVLDKLAALGLEDRTIVIFTADHGEELLEHGRLGHGQSLFEEVIRVPLIVAGPEIPHGVRMADPISNRHVAPTLAWRGGARMDAVTATQDLTDPRSIRKELVQVQTVKGRIDGLKMFLMEGVIVGDHAWHYSRRCYPWDWKVIPHQEDSTRPAQDYLRYYDLGADPLQERLHGMSTEKSEFVNNLLKVLENQGALRRGVVLPAGASTIADLEGIGYVSTDDAIGGESEFEHVSDLAVDHSAVIDLLHETLLEQAAFSRKDLRDPAPTIE